MNDTTNETDETEVSFDQAVELARKKWKAVEGTIIRYGDGTWIRRGSGDRDLKGNAHDFS